MKVFKTRYWPGCILFAGFFIWSYSSGHKYECDNERCDRGRCWSQTAGCVSIPGP